MRDRVVIYVNGKRLTIAGAAVFSPLAEFLRERGLVGTKIGCGEGDCGACTVLAGTPADGSIRYRPIVSCIQPLHQLDGKHVVTIEGQAQGGELSPVQQAMVEHHGSQCGFCTPGFVNALAGHFESVDPADSGALRTSLAGNLCRCTGYVPILEAGMAIDPAKVNRLSSRYASRALHDDLEACQDSPILI